MGRNGPWPVGAPARGWSHRADVVPGDHTRGCQGQIRRLRRPGVTAAATTAVLATGDGPGDTALATTAVLATGWPMTPTRPTRAARRGMSFSFARAVVGLDRGDDGLDGDAAVCDELSARTPGGGCERRGPQVLPDQDSGRASRLHGGGEVHDV